jgi:hypothetical protein
MNTNKYRNSECTMPHLREKIVDEIGTEYGFDYVVAARDERREATHLIVSRHGALERVSLPNLGFKRTPR